MHEHEGLWAAPLRMIKAIDLMKATSGDPRVKIAIVDGPLDTTHPALSHMRAMTPNNNSLFCNFRDSIACIHGTFVAGILGAKRGYAAPGMCPDCSFIVRQIFLEGTSRNGLDLPSTSAENLADAIIYVVDAGANIINLSVGLTSTSLMKYPSIISSLCLCPHAWSISSGCCR